MAPLLFRADIPLPAGVSVGNYEVDVRLFADGAVIARTPSAFEVYKAGFEQYVTTTARNHGLLFGLATAMMALATGWLGSRDFPAGLISRPDSVVLRWRRVGPSPSTCAVNLRGPNSSAKARSRTFSPPA